jgi:hypothetical protein
MNRIRNFILATFAALAATLVSPVSSALAGQSPGNSQVVVTFTKWVLDTGVMPGVVGGELGNGVFAGQLLGGVPKADGKILKLDARYGVVVDCGRSFNAVIHGTMNSQTGIGVLNGVIVDGWLTGAQVTVRFQALPSSEHGMIFVGTITINPNSAD